MSHAGGNGEATGTLGKRLGGCTGKGFLPGQSGNPSGGSPGLVRMIRKLTRDGQQIARFMHQVFQGQPIDGKRPRLDHRLEAATWLADRAWGKPRQTHDITVPRSTLFRRADGVPLALPPAPGEDDPEA